MLERLGLRYVTSRFSDHDRQLHLVVELLRDHRVIDDRLVGADDRERGLQEELRIVLLNGGLLVTMIPVVLAGVEDGGRNEGCDQSDVLERPHEFAGRRPGCIGESLLRCPPRRLQSRDKPGHVRRDANCGDLRRSWVILDVGEVAGVYALEVDDAAVVDCADCAPGAVLVCHEPHAATPSRTLRSASAARRASRSESGKSGSGRRTGPHSRPSIRSPSFVGET